jgi:hypothetical protein
VNIKTSGWIFSGLTICVALLGCATQSEVVSLGGNTYSVTRKATTAFARDTDQMTAKAKEDAAHYCAAQGKQLKILDVVVNKPFYSTGYASAKVVFKAVNPGEANLASEPVSAAVGADRVAVETSQKTSTDDLYAELTKLDDLRKKGILTDEEFQAQKKKILSHSN